MTYNIDNLTAGLDTFTKPTVSRYDKAIKAFNNKLTAGIPHRQAVDETLKEAINGLAKPEEKLQAARNAAGIYSRTQSIQTGASTAATAILTKVQNAKKPRFKLKSDNKRKSFFQRHAEKKALAKVRASNDPSTPPKARKRTIAWWIFLGIFASFAGTFLVELVLTLISGGPVSYVAIGFLVFPFTLAIFIIIGYLKAIKPHSTDDSEDGPFATSHTPTQA